MSGAYKKPGVKDILTALDNSGYLLEQFIAPVLEESGFVVETNYHYLDPDDKTSREMDLRGYTLKKISRKWLSHYLSITLVISCKSNKNPIIFFQRKSAIPPEYTSGDFLMISNPDKIPGQEAEPVDIQDYINLRKFHHYYKSPNLSTQFCEVAHNEKSKKFETRHEEYKSEILPLIKAMDFETKRVKDEELTSETINIHTIYPLLILGGDIYTCRILSNQKPQVRKSQHVSYLQAYNSDTLKGEFRIDVISERYIKKFLKQIDLETDEIIKRVDRKRKYLVQIIKNSRKEKGGKDDQEKIN